MRPVVEMNCYKITQQANLSKVAASFEVPFSQDSGCLMLQPEQIGSVLKSDVVNRFVWLFRYGCICFANFETAEIYRFLRYLESISEQIDFGLFSTYNENHRLEFADAVDPKTNLLILGLYALLLARSTELKYLENSLDLIFERSERLLFDLQRGFSKPINRTLKKATLDLTRLQLYIINNLKILDRPKDYDDLKLKLIYDSTAQYYGLKKRFKTIQQKIDSLTEILTPYQRLGYNRQEARLYILEVFLIALFPLFRIFNYFFAKILTSLHFL